MAAVTTARGTCNSVPNCVLSSNRLLWRAQEVFIHCIMMILVAGAVPLIYSFHINLHNIMWEEHIFGVPTSVVTNGFYPALEELCLRVSCWDLQGQRVTHSSRLDLCHLPKTHSRIAGGNLEQRYSHAFRCTRQNTSDFETDNYLPSTDAYYNVPHLHQN